MYFLSEKNLAGGPLEARLLLCRGLPQWWADFKAGSFGSFDRWLRRLESFRPGPDFSHMKPSEPPMSLSPLTMRSITLELVALHGPCSDMAAHKFSASTSQTRPTRTC